MRTFSQQPKTTQSNKSPKLDRLHARQPDQTSIVNLQRTIGNQAFKRLLQSNAGESSGAATLAQAIQRAPGAGRMLYRAPATNLRGYPAGERRGGQQSTNQASMIDSAFLQGVLGPPTQDTGVTYVFGGTTVFDPSIPAALHRGLASTGTYLADNTNVLPLGTTQSLVLNLTPFSGPNAIFRFTHLNHTENRATAPVLLIENVGPAPAAIAPVTARSGSFTVRGQNFIAGSGWNDQQFGRLQALLAMLPDVVLTEAAGTTFALRGQGRQDEAGHYDAAHDTI